MLWIGLGVIGLAVYTVIIYNGLIKTRNMVNEAWSGIDVQLKRRSNLIPNLVETVRGYSSHEQSVLEDIAHKRTAAMQAQGTREKGAAENALSGSIRSIFALAEAYPDLKASESFLSLQAQLVEVEDQIQLARRYYNGSVRILNNKVQSFPGNLVAGIFGFSAGEFFTLELTTEGDAPRIGWEE